MIKKIVSSLLLLFVTIILNAQPFANDIAAFKKQDSIAPPPKNAILFVGSSSFTKWKDVQSYFPNYTIINRGFGGSILLDVIRYEKDIIFPYQPKQIVIYCGEKIIYRHPTTNAKSSNRIHFFKTVSVKMENERQDDEEQYADQKIFEETEAYHFHQRMEQYAGCNW